MIYKFDNFNIHIINIVFIIFILSLKKLVFELSKTFNIYVSLSSFRVYLARAWSDAQTLRLRNTRRANSLMRMDI